MADTDIFAHLPTEIKQEIFDALSRESLPSALLVSKSWYAQTVRLVWSEVTLRSIWYIRNSRNAEIYLSSIRSLILGLRDDRYHAQIIDALGQPLFPNLEKISYVPGVLMGPQSLDYIIPYLQPSLLKFYSISGELSAKFLSALRETCTRLEDLRIKMPWKNITKEMSISDFHSWLEGIPTLRAISLFNKGGVNSNSTVDVIIGQMLSKSTVQGLLKKPLRRLCLEYPVDTLDELDTDSIRHTLRDFSIITKPSVIPGLCGLERLQKLQLRVDGDCAGGSILSPICSLLELRSLKLIFTGVCELESEQVMLLKQLTKLEELEIRTGTTTSDRFGRHAHSQLAPIAIRPFFDESDFDKLASLLPRLHHVCLLFDWKPNSAHIFKSISLHWPDIRFLCLGYNLDLYESALWSKDRKPLLPSLKNLATVHSLFTDETGYCDDSMIRSPESL